ncbi:3-oxoacyl-ACP reductase [Planctomycetales bacterium]|nr:3-oxoacyl-ACP reductase [Planctomycetales bacterium]
MSINKLKTVLITGASGGIGRAAARKFAESGAAVLLHAHKNIASVSALQQEIQNNGGEADVLTADFTDQDSAETLVRQVFDRFDHLDILVNAAGLDLMSDAVKQESFEKKLQLLFQTDCLTPIRLSRLIGKRMSDRQQGTIFFLGWNGVQHGWQGETAQLYGAAKGALLGFSRSLAETLSPDVRVCCLSLGWIKTAWGKKLSGEIERRYASDSLQNRWGTPEDVAETIMFLSGKSSGFVDAIGLPIDGGKRGSR